MFSHGWVVCTYISIRCVVCLCAFIFVSRGDFCRIRQILTILVPVYPDFAWVSTELGLAHLLQGPCFFLSLLKHLSWQAVLSSPGHFRSLRLQETLTMVSAGSCGRILYRLLPDVWLVRRCLCSVSPHMRKRQDGCSGEVQRWRHKRCKCNLGQLTKMPSLKKLNICVRTSTRGSLVCCGLNGKAKE